MPKVTAQGKTFECPQGANLREVLLQNGIDLYNGATSAINCYGLGTCGTCAVQVEGAVSETEWRERTKAQAASSFFHAEPATSLPSSGFRRCQSDKI